MVKVGICLSGCGVYDGSEIYESVITLLALDRAGAEIICFAPQGRQRKVVDHSTGQVQDESRDIFVEAGRLARGEIKNIKDIQAADLDAVIFPGGFGAALNLCDFAVAGEKCSVHPEVERLLKEAHAAKKPIGAICIAPAVVARVLGSTRTSKLPLALMPQLLTSWKRWESNTLAAR